MADEAYTLKVDGDIEALSQQINKAMSELAKGVSDNQAEQMRSAAIVEKERIASESRVKAVEIKAIRDRELEELRMANRVELARTRASMRLSAGGAGNTSNQSFLSSLLGAENATATLSTKVRIVSAEFLKMATFSRSATLSLNAFRGAAGWLSGGVIAVGILALTQALGALGDMFQKNREEAKKTREEHEAFNKEMLKSAVILGMPKSFMSAINKLPGNENMLEEFARKGYVGVSGLQALSDKYGDVDRSVMATKMVLDGYSEDTAKAFATLWEVTKGGVVEFAQLAENADKEVKQKMRMKATGGHSGMYGGGISYEVVDLNREKNEVIKSAQKTIGSLSDSLGDPRYFNLQDLTVAASEFKTNQKEAAKKVKSLHQQIVEALTNDLDKLTKEYYKKQKAMDKWMSERDETAKSKFGVDRPTDSFFDIQKALADYATAYKGERNEIVRKMEDVLSGMDEMIIIWNQLERL